MNSKTVVLVLCIGGAGALAITQLASGGANLIVLVWCVVIIVLSVRQIILDARKN